MPGGRKGPQMPTWFSNLAEVQEPGTQQLQIFVDGVRQFLGFVLRSSNDFAFLWRADPALLDMAFDTFSNDIAAQCDVLKTAIPLIEQRQLTFHGLRDRALRFKFRVLA